MIVFTILYSRYGDDQSHTYLGKSWGTYIDALKDASKHMEFRSGKYSARIFKQVLGGTSTMYRDLPYEDRILNKKEINLILKGDNK